jgi:hypothetical protein
MSALQPLIQSRILTLRGQRVMLDADLAELYGVQTKVQVQAVKRNSVRFPSDFMFQLSIDEFADLRSQTVTSSGHGGRRTAPYAFTQQGVAMLSSALSSSRAVAVNVEIMRTFVRVRALAVTHADLAKRLSELEEKTEALAMKRDDLSCTARQQLKQVLDALRALMTPPDPPKRPIGFVIRLTNVRGADLLSASIAPEDSQSPDCPALPTGCEQSSNAAPVRRRQSDT